MEKNSRGSMNLGRLLPWILLIGSLVGLTSSLILTLEKFSALENPNYQPACNLNPIFSCTTVGSSDQAFAFGFYNPFLGLAGFAALAALALALLAGASFKKWLWQLMLVGLLFAVGFVTWLQFETLYRIGALCLFCMTTWAATIPMFWYTFLYVFENGSLAPPNWFKRPLSFMRRHHGDILLLWFLVIIALIGKRFWYYWSGLF